MQQKIQRLFINTQIKLETKRTFLFLKISHCRKRVCIKAFLFRHCLIVCLHSASNSFKCTHALANRLFLLSQNASTLYYSNRQKDLWPIHSQITPRKLELSNSLSCDCAEMKCAVA
ncbi:hypothetical protein NERG_00069 [Nematocida ausubeli]|uniref:Uncharacterized protein n=1 Tax=Nematocida ausubeli (strain ATCC PRA-371 / ERTm2) TaxID=1913371 RepID=H8Z8Z8_NEMA1|nr:hypothetical protein NERG_00069 [Nematocida ausubeli]